MFADQRHTRRLTAAVLLVLLLSCVGWPSNSTAETAGEYQLKAAFLYNAPKFVEWPAEALSSPAFTIGVLGDDPFGPLLDQLAGRSIKGKQIVIRRITSPERATECQLLFIAASEQRRLQAVLGRLRELPLLTVSDIDGFAFAGGMLELGMDRNRLTFIANIRQAKRQGLKISSQMLKLAREIVE